MNRKTFGILAIVAVIFGALALFGQRGSDTGSIAGASAGQLLLPDLAAGLEAVRAVEITGAGDERLATLRRDDSGWVVAEQDSYPAANGQINALLIDLAETRIVEEKTANPDYHARLGVEAVSGPDAGGLRVTLLADGDDRYDVVLGDSYGEGQRYARLGDRVLSVLIDRNPEVASDAAGWVESEIVDIAGRRIQRVTITHADGDRVVIRKQFPDDSNFTVDDVPAGRELQYAGVANVTGNVLQKLTLDEVSAAPSAAAEPQVVTEFWTFEGLVVTVTAVADEDDDPWLGFAARFDTGQALEFATDPADGADGDQADAAPETDAATDANAAPETDAIAEAQAINARLAGWRYRIPSYKYSQLTRRMEDLLEAPAEDAE